MPPRKRTKAMAKKASTPGMKKTASRAANAVAADGNPHPPEVVRTDNPVHEPENPQIQGGDDDENDKDLNDSEKNVAEEKGFDDGMQDNVNSTADIEQMSEIVAEVEEVENEEIEGDGDAGIEVIGDSDENTDVEEVEEDVKTEIQEVEAAMQCGDTANVTKVDGVREGEDRSDEVEDGEEQVEEGMEVDSDGSSEEDNGICTYNHDDIQKDIEIFVGKLDRQVVEADLIEVFEKFGELKSVRIIMHPTTKKSKGFAFIRYNRSEQAKIVLSELKDGIEVKGKQVSISESQNNSTLYMGNICKTWTKEQVLETLRGCGVENLDNIRLPDASEGKIKGFAFLEFSTHSDALVAFQRLKKPDAIFGRDISAKVAFAHTSVHHSDEDLLKVKTVYVEGLNDSWDAKKVQEICKQFGEIGNISLSQNLGTKRKDFGFITFLSRESALACIEGINSGRIGDREVKAELSKPKANSRLHKVTCGGFRVVEESKKMEAVSSKDGCANFNGAEMKDKASSKQIDSKTITNSRYRGETNKNAIKNHKRKSSRVDEVKGDKYQESSERPKKKRESTYSGKSSALRNPSDLRLRKGPTYGAKSFRNQQPRGYASKISSRGYAPEKSSYNYHAVSTSNLRHTDMEPHAGYLDSSVVQRAQAYTGYHAVRVQGQLHPRSFQPTVRLHSNDLYGYGMTRLDGYDGIGSIGTSYGRVPAHPVPHVEDYSNRVVYKVAAPGDSSLGYHYGSTIYGHRRA